MKARSRSYHQQARAESARDNRALIVEVATKQFLERAYEEVTLQTVAQAASVSRQTILNHFGSKEGLLEAIAQRITRERQGAPSGDSTDAIARLCANYEWMGDANVRLLAIEETVPVAARLLSEGRASHQAWLAATFAQSLPERGPERARMLATLHAATDVYVWKLLRRDLGHSRRQTQHIIEHLVRGALTTTPRAAESSTPGEDA
jgi:AcrR family transcriptional regulator